MRKINRRDFLKAMGAACAAAGLAGCGAASSSTAAASSAAASSAASSGAAVPTEAVNLKFANYALLEDAYTEFWNGVKTKFEAKYPNITIEWVTAPYADITSTVTTMAGAGDKCDMVFGEVSWASTFEDSGLSVPVTDVLDADFLDGFYESALQACTIDGDIYGLPMYVSPFIIYYNTDILKTAGADKVPATYDELLAACEKIKGMKTSDGNVIYPFGQTTASVPISGSALNSMIYNFGGQVLDDTGALSIDNDGFHQAIEMLQTLDKNGYNPQNCKLKDLRNLFALGQLAMYYDQSWGISGVKAINADIDSVTASAVPLSGGSGKGASILNAHVLYYADNGEANRQACALLTQYLMSDEVLGDYMANIVPAYPALKSMSVPDNHVLTGAADAINVAVAAPFVPALNDLNLELCTLAQAVTVSGGDVDSSIEDFRKAATTLLNG